MNVHCTLYHRICCFGIHHVEQHVNHFIASCPKDGSTENQFSVCVDRDLDEALSFAFLNSAAHSAHRIFRDERSASGFPNFGLRHAASAERGIDEQSVCLDSVGDAPVVSVKQIV